MQAEATIQAGICGFTTTVAAICNDGQTVRLELTSPCPRITALAQGLSRLDGIDAFGELDPTTSGPLMNALRDPRQGLCVGCVVPTGVFKTMQVAANLSLPGDISITLRSHG